MTVKIMTQQPQEQQHQHRPTTNTMKQKSAMKVTKTSIKDTRCVNRTSIETNKPTNMTRKKCDCHVFKTMSKMNERQDLPQLYDVDINNNIIDRRITAPNKFHQKMDPIPEDEEYSLKRAKLNRTISGSSNGSVQEYCYIDSSKLLRLWEWSRETRGLGLMFAFMAVICWSANSLCYKLINDRLEPLVMFTFTSLFVALFYLAWILCFYKPSIRCKQNLASKEEKFLGKCKILQSLSILAGAPGERLHLFSRCILGTISQGALYTSYKYIPMADATTIRFTSPVFIAIFAHFLVDEPFGMLQLINVITTLIGVVLVGRPSFFFGYEIFSTDDPESHSSLQNSSNVLTTNFQQNSSTTSIQSTEQIYGLVLALIAALSISVSMISVRKLKATPAALVIFWFSMSNVILGAGTLFLMGQSFIIDWTVTVIVFFVVTSIGTTMDQFCITMALKLENAGAVAVIQALCVLFSFILSITVVGETIHITSAFGGSLIFLSVVILAGAKWYSELDAYSKFGSRASLNTTSSTVSGTDDQFEVNLKSYVHNQNQFQTYHCRLNQSSLRPIIDGQSNTKAFRSPAFGPSTLSPLSLRVDRSSPRVSRNNLLDLSLIEQCARNNTPNKQATNHV